MSAPFLPMTTPGRAEWMVTRHFLCGRSITIFDTAACLSCFISSARILMSSCSSVPYSFLPEIPARVPGAVDAETQADRIDLLTHLYSLRLCLLPLAPRPHERRWSGWQNGLKILPTRPRPRGRETLDHQRLADMRLGDDEIVDVEVVIVLGIGDRRIPGTCARPWRCAFCENSRSASALATFLPRISCATRLSFCGDTRSMRETALASLSSSVRSRELLPISNRP